MKIKYQYSSSLQFTSYTCFCTIHLGRYISVNRALNCATHEVKCIYGPLLIVVFRQKIAFHVQHFMQNKTAQIIDYI